MEFTNDDSKSQNYNLKSILTGLAIGAIIVYLFMKSRPPTTQQIQPMKYLEMQATYNNILEEKLSTIEAQLQKLQKLQNQTSHPSQTQSQPQTPIENTLYKNNESWEVFRGKDGFISKLSVLRDVKTNR